MMMIMLIVDGVNGDIVLQDRSGGSFKRSIIQGPTGSTATVGVIVIVVIAISLDQTAVSRFSRQKASTSTFLWKKKYLL